jgi:hypothetical protein
MYNLRVYAIIVRQILLQIPYGLAQIKNAYFYVVRLIVPYEPEGIPIRLYDDTSGVLVNYYTRSRNAPIPLPSK